VGQAQASSLIEACFDANPTFREPASGAQTPATTVSVAWHGLNLKEMKGYAANGGFDGNRTRISHAG
jgi:hypothetical protein